ncbi:hypothetical protein DPX16_14522 [Anabarilius grahami]|uniref:Uncharacterized protein n=1 Tax=Anabarilius grahami TaxID=495550 RepID=A0A3N0YY22_ANAGA|nr:hypothetical protein DPX16_14522 [Anabarilius grahami]
MEFLKSLVPTVISGDGGLPATDAGGVWPRETGPRLLRMKRLVSQANEEEYDGSTPTSRPAVRLQRHRAKGFKHKQIINFREDSALARSGSDILNENARIGDNA